jgi:hypothetical protein
MVRSQSKANLKISSGATDMLLGLPRDIQQKQKMRLKKNHLQRRQWWMMRRLDEMLQPMSIVPSEIGRSTTITLQALGGVMLWLGLD